MTIVLQYLPYLTPNPSLYLTMNSSAATTIATTIATASNKNEPPKTKTPMCDNCNYRPVATALSCKIYEDWCALCNLTLLSTKDSE